MSSELEITAFTTGRVRPKRRARGLRRWLPGGWSDVTLPVNAFVVRHPEGVLLFDTGRLAHPGRAASLPGRHPFLRLARFELGAGDELSAQLGRGEVDPEEVRWVALSHLHVDHAGGVTAFPRAEVMVSAVEWARARGLRGWLRGYAAREWRGVSFHLVDFTGPSIGPFPASHDVAGDGRLLLVPTGGHTSGHLALVLPGEDGAFLGGDLAKTPNELAASQPAVAEFCAREGLRVLLTHDDAARELASR